MMIKAYIYEAVKC